VGIDNPVHLLFIAAVALVVLGPKRLPALARALGQAMREFKSALDQGAEHSGEIEPAIPPAPAHHAGIEPTPPADAG
jgi:TatA/E family protein of Tat protein translocase